MDINDDYQYHTKKKYHLPFHGNLSSGLIKCYQFTEEIAKQLIDSGAKVIFGQVQMSKTLEEAVMMSKMDVKIVYVKENESDTIPASGVSFSELIDTRGKIVHTIEIIKHFYNLIFYRN